MKRILTILVTILVLALGQFAAARHDGAGVAAAGNIIVSMVDGGHGVPHPAGHEPGATDHCHVASCSLTIFADRTAAGVLASVGPSRHRKPAHDAAAKAATLGQDPPIPRFPV